MLDQEGNTKFLDGWRIDVDWSGDIAFPRMAMAEKEGRPRLVAYGMIDDEAIEAVSEKIRTIERMGS